MKMYLWDLQTWIKQFSNKFENVDIITLNKSNENIGTNNKVNIYGY